MLDISQLGKGARQTPKPIRDRHFRIALSAPVPIDWSTPYQIPAHLTVRNQNGSSSCTAQAASYFCEALDQIEHNHTRRSSARYIYSKTNLGPDQGSYIWKAMSVPLAGVADSNSVPDGDSSEAIMRDASLNDKAILYARTEKYAVIPKSNIDQIAQVIHEYNGIQTGFNGHNGMFAPDGTVTNWATADWGHSVFLLGHEMRNGVKCIKFINSWSDQWGSQGYGYFPEAFINSGMMYDLYTYADITDLDPSSVFQLVQVPGSQEVWLLRDVPTIVNGQTVGVQKKKTHIYNAAALQIISDFSSITAITQQALDLIPDTGLDLASLIKE